MPGRVMFQLGVFAVAVLLSVATSNEGEYEDAKGPDTQQAGEDTAIGHQDVPDSCSEDGVTLALGGGDFLVTGDGDYLVALRSEYQCRDHQYQCVSRELVVIDTSTGAQTVHPDLCDAHELSVAFLTDPREMAVVHRRADWAITKVEWVELPSLRVFRQYTPTDAYPGVRFSPDGSYLAFLSTLWPHTSFVIFQTDARVNLVDMAGGQQLTLSVPYGIVDVSFSPSSPHAVIGMSEYPLDTYNSLTSPRIKLHRVDLTNGLTYGTLIHENVTHDSNLSLLSGATRLEYRPDGSQLILSGCRYVSTDTCLEHWFVLDPETLQLLAELDAVGEPAFFPDGGATALGWSGARNGNDELLNKSCTTMGDTEWEPTPGMDHWLVVTDLDTSAQQVIDVPGYHPIYLHTGRGSHGLASVTDCAERQLYAVDFDTGSASAIAGARYGLGQLSLTEDPRVLFALHDSALHRIDLEALVEAPFGPGAPWGALSFLPNRGELVVASLDMLTFRVLDANTGEVLDVFRLGLAQTQQSVTVPDPAPTAFSASASARWRPFWPARVRRPVDAPGTLHRLTSAKHDRIVP